MKILFAGGGTGGHVFPAIATAQALTLLHRDAQALFVGTEKGLEAKAVPEAGFPIAFIQISGLRGKSRWNQIRTLFKLPYALWQAALILLRERPKAVVSVGGYVAAPTALMAWLFRIPLVVMEQNSVPGLTNRILAKLATLICASVPSRLLTGPKVEVLGNPVREDLRQVGNAAFSPQSPTRILVMGGSQGARAINEWVAKWASLINAEHIHIVHQCGALHYEDTYRFLRHAHVLDADGQSTYYKLVPFISNMRSAYAEADLVICRSGATTCAELCVAARPSILIPFPFATDDHQTENAKVLVEHGAAVLLPQCELSEEKMREVVLDLASDSERLKKMSDAAKGLGKPDAAMNIAAKIVGVGRSS